METKTKDLKSIIKHADIQSLLDLKAFFGEISFDVFNKLGSDSERIVCIKDPKIKAMFFFIKTDKGYNMFSALTPRMYKDLKDFDFVFKSEAPKGFIATVIYKGNKKLYNLLKSVGFSAKKEIVIGVEQRNFVLMEFDND